MFRPSDTAVVAMVPIRALGRRARAFGWTFGFVLMMCIPQSITAQSSAPDPALYGAEAMLQPGDMVRIEVWRQPELSGEFLIAGDGSIRHPLYRDVQVAGVPLETAEQRLESFLRGFESNPQFIMAPLLAVAVGGEVNEPSLYQLPPEVTIAEAVARAGGPTERGRLNQVRLLRNGRELILDLTQPDVELTQMTIRSGDQILVGRRRDIWREYIAPAASVTGAIASVVIAVSRISN